MRRNKNIRTQKNIAITEECRERDEELLSLTKQQVTWVCGERKRTQQDGKYRDIVLIIFPKKLSSSPHLQISDGGK